MPQQSSRTLSHPLESAPDRKSPASSLAVFTIVQDEPRFLPLWLRYYSRVAEHLIILNNDTRDGSVEASVAAFPGVEVVHIPHETSFDHQWLRDTVQQWQRRLLQRHLFVLFAEADELVIPDPRFYPVGADRRILLRYALADGLASEPMAFRCQGYEVVHDHRAEPPLHWDVLPLLRQRRFWAPNRWYSKTLLASMPLSWSLGFHETTHPAPPPRSDLFLLHLHRIDYGYAEARHASRLARRWSADDLQQQRGLQNRLTGPELEKWFYHPESYGQAQLVLEPMPDYFQNIV